MSRCRRCAAAPASLTPIAAAPVETRAPVTILVSIDGFRPDYLDRGVTPNLNALAAAGISAAMRPSYPSKTFPNHWTLVTGLRPDRTGIVANKMFDAARPGEKFTMMSDDPFWWNAAEPIWVTAEKAGIHTATAFWPGSNVAWGGQRAKEWPYELTGGVAATGLDAVQHGDRRPPASRCRGRLDAPPGGDAPALHDAVFR